MPPTMRQKQNLSPSTSFLASITLHHRAHMVS